MNREDLVCPHCSSKPVHAKKEVFEVTLFETKKSNTQSITAPFLEMCEKKQVTYIV